MDVKFRADVHAPRHEVEGEPEEPIVATYLSPATFGRVTGSGSTTEKGTTISYLGTDEMRILGKAEVDAGGMFSTTESVFGGLATLDPEAGNAELCFSLSGKVTIRIDPPEGPTEEYDAVLLLLFLEMFDSVSGQMGCLDLPMDPTYTLQGGKRTHSESGVTMTLEWTNFQATTPPDENTEG